MPLKLPQLDLRRERIRPEVQIRSRGAVSGPPGLGRVGPVVAQLVLAFAVAAVCLPFAWMLLTSVKVPSDIFSGRVWPSRFAWENYARAWEAAPFGRYFFNTAVVALATVALQLATSAAAAFAFARMRFFGREVLFYLLLATMMVPEEVTLVANYVTLYRLGWLDTYRALIVPWGASAFAIFMLRQFFASIPDDLEDAAKIDGCGRLAFFWRIMLPLARPALTTVALFALVGSWNAFTWPLVVTNSQMMRTVQVGVSFFAQEFGTNYTLLMAAATVAVAPVLVLFAAVHSQFTEGIARSGLK